jgi:hypothetical protein
MYIAGLIIFGICGVIAINKNCWTTETWIVFTLV